MATEEQLLEKLNELMINYTILEHEVITTMTEGQEIMKKLSGCVPINLLLKDKTGNYYLLIKDVNSKIKFGDLNNKLKTKGMTMVKPEEMTRMMNVPQGCTTVFGLLNSSTSQLTVLIDEAIQTEMINFHPLRNNATLTLRYEDMIRFIESCGNTYKKIN